MKKQIPLFLILNYVLCMVHLSAFGQITFNLHDSIPVTKYGNSLLLPWAGGINYPMWNEIDLNQDGKKDLFMFDRSDNRVTILMNDGTAGPTAFHFDSNSVKYAKMFPALSGWAYLYDYDNDGLPDLFTVDTSTNSGIVAYKSSYNAGKWTFTVVAAPIMTQFGPGNYSNLFASTFLTPFFVDMDGDGDMDIVGHQSLCVGCIAYYENETMQKYGVPGIDTFKYVTNSWAHFALRSGQYCEVIDGFDSLFYNAIPDSSVLNRAISPIDWNPGDVARKDDSYFCIRIMNLNGDSLMDAIIGDAQAKNLLALYNHGSKADAWMSKITQDTAFPSYDKPVRLSSFNCPSYVDVDNDGKKDLIVGNREYEDRKGMLFYKNNGNDSFPNLNYQNDSLFQSQMIDVGEASSPVFFDYDHDGLLDLVIGGFYSADSACFSIPYLSALTLYRNVGTATNPAFQFITDDFGGLSALTYPGPTCPFHPTFGDLDGDGKPDMIVGSFDGTLMYFHNNGGAGPAVFNVPPVAAYMSIDVGNCAMPQLIDVDNDGLLDLLVGESNGTLNYFHNNGTKYSPVFPSIPVDSFGKVDVHYLNYFDGYSVPYMFRDHGSLKLLVSCMQGNVLLYDSIDNNLLSGKFHLHDTILQKDYGNRTSATAFGYGISVGGGDINDDGNEDMVLGLYGGGVQIYYGDFPVSINETAPSKIVFDVYPNPVNDMLSINIHHRQPDELYSLSVFNAIGQVVYSQKVSWGNQIIDTRRFADGIYLLQLRTSEQSVSAKIIVNH